MISVEWFCDNFSSLNDEKWHLIVLGHEEQVMYASIDDALLLDENSLKLLGLLIDSELREERNFLDC